MTAPIPTSRPSLEAIAHAHDTRTERTVMQTSEVLNKAADLIETEGWWGGGRGGDSPQCAANAIYNASDRVGSIFMPAQKALVRYIGGDSLGCIWRWNDDPGRTATAVIEVLRATAVIEAAREANPVTGAECELVAPADAVGREAS